MVDFFKDLLSFLLVRAFSRSKERVDRPGAVKLKHFVSKGLEALNFVDDSLNRLTVLVAGLSQEKKQGKAEVSTLLNLYDSRAYTHLDYLFDKMATDREN